MNSWGFFSQWEKKKKERAWHQTGACVLLKKHVHPIMYSRKAAPATETKKTINLSVQRKYDIILVPTVAVR